jgi:DNA repair photolyase
MSMMLLRIEAKRIFVRTKLPGCKWVINQYVGCEHACKYCYAKFMCRWKKHGRWGSWVEIKQNAPELVKGKFVRGWVYMSSVSDPYQPIEREVELTRRVLSNMDKRIRLSILTKSDLVLRDLNLFKLFPRIEVGLTLNGFEGKAKRRFEPNSPTHPKRVDALRALAEAGIKTFGFISPIIPGLVDVEELIAETKHFVDHYWMEMLNLRASGREFNKLLETDFPQSFEAMKDKAKLQAYVEGLKRIARESGVRVAGIVLHYPSFSILRLKQT